MGATRPRRAARIAVAVTASLAIASGVGAAVFAAFVYSWRNVGVDTTFEPVSDPQDSSPSGACTQPCNILLLGSDSRTGLSASQQGHFGSNRDLGDSSRADTIMLVHLDPDTSKTVVLSFPRDLWVNIPGHGRDKINAAFEGGAEGGGPELMAKTVFALTHIPIDHYLYVDLNGFERVVNTLGGVTMCIPSYYVNTPGYLEATDPSGATISIHYTEVGHVADPYTGLDVLPGCQHLDGTQALAYVRSRHNLPCSAIPDFARIGRQQQFMRALINQMLRPAQLARAPALVGPVLSSIRRDSGLRPADLVYLVGQMRGLSTGAVQFRSVSGTNALIDGLAVVKMDPADRKLFAAIRDDAPLPQLGSDLPLTPPSPANISVEVIDAGDEAAANEVEGTLSAAGFDVRGIVRGGMPAGVTKAAIMYAPGKDAHAEVVQSFFTNLPTIEAKDLDVPVAVLIAAGYRPASPAAAGSTSPPPASECPSPG